MLILVLIIHRKLFVALGSNVQNHSSGSHHPVKNSPSKISDFSTSLLNDVWKTLKMLSFLLFFHPWDPQQSRWMFKITIRKPGSFFMKYRNIIRNNAISSNISLWYLFIRVFVCGVHSVENLAFSASWFGCIWMLLLVNCSIPWVITMTIPLWNKCDASRDLVAFVLNLKNLKNTHGEAALLVLKVTLLHRCSLRFWNCANGIKFSTKHNFTKKLINEVIKPGPKTTAVKIYRFAVSNSSVNKTISITIEFLLWNRFLHHAQTRRSEVPFSP